MSPPAVFCQIYTEWNAGMCTHTHTHTLTYITFVTLNCRGLLQERLGFFVSFEKQKEGIRDKHQQRSNAPECGGKRNNYQVDWRQRKILVSTVERRVWSLPRVTTSSYNYRLLPEWRNGKKPTFHTALVWLAHRCWALASFPKPCSFVFATYFVQNLWNQSRRLLNHSIMLPLLFWPFAMCVCVRARASEGAPSGTYSFNEWAGDKPYHQLSSLGQTLISS